MRRTLALIAALLLGTALVLQPATAGAAPDPPWRLTMTRRAPITYTPAPAQGWMVANAYGTQCYIYNAFWSMTSFGNPVGRAGVQYYWCGRLLENIVLTGSHSAWIPDDTDGDWHEEHAAETEFAPAGGSWRGVHTDWDYAYSDGWDIDVDLIAKLWANGGITGNWVRSV